jgi:G:T-mismatch repair DNA endonuclease (very short patch repair protein)/endogenous inhibitor of DNA gyrase (YacG/DUF329 family)
MDRKIKNKIISEYKKGKGSTKIEKELGIPKYKILKVLNDENIVRQKDRCRKLGIKKKDNRYYLHRKCPNCGKDVEVSSNNHSIACRNYYNTLTRNCRKCSFELQKGEANPFYGKKHTKESLIKMTKTLTENPRKFSSSSKPEKKIEKILKDMNFNVVRTFKVGEYICDIFVPEFNLIIEYNGDYWHCNPNKYNKDYLHPHKKKTSSEIWEDDRIRVDNIINYGYTLEVVWESDFNPELTIQNIIKKYVKN